MNYKPYLRIKKIVKVNRNRGTDSIKVSRYKVKRNSKMSRRKKLRRKIKISRSNILRRKIKMNRSKNMNRVDSNNFKMMLPIQ